MSRRAQPYRRGAREPGPALAAMLRGRGANDLNPADAARTAARMEQAQRDRLMAVPQEQARMMLALVLGSGRRPRPPRRQRPGRRNRQV